MNKKLLEMNNHYSKSYLKKKYKNFWNKGIFYTKWSTESWIEMMKQNSSIRTVQLPNVLVKLQLEKKITKEQADTIEAMLKSSDKENWTVAIMLMKQIRSKKF
jgi:hypothetical protein